MKHAIEAQEQALNISMEDERACPVCCSTSKSVLMHQRFAGLSYGSLLAGYDLAICVDCGASYADKIPAQENFDRYYAEMSKYEYGANAGIQTSTDRARFREIANLVDPHLHSSSHMLDIGCATGGLLAEFKHRGYKNLMGVDPSHSCSDLTERLHGIRSKPSTISDLDKLGEQFDILFLTGVVEHLRDVDGSVRQLKTCLRAGGLIYIEVPDATRYDKHFGAPFQFFSIEHINFFSPQSLGNLMARHGFECVFTERLIRYLSPEAIEPVMGGMFRLSPEGDVGKICTHDAETLPALKRYIEQSVALEQRVLARIDQLVDSGREIVVWGTHASID